MMMTDFAALRRNMVDCQLRTYDVTDRAVLAAMDSVPREDFVPEARKPLAYLDQPVALDQFGAADRALLAPMTCGRMLQSLDVQPGQSFLDYAAGTGYTAALAAELGASVTAFEADPALRSVMWQILTNRAGGAITVAEGLPSARFDHIFVNGACAVPPESLTALLSERGRLVFIKGIGRAGKVMLYQNAGGAVSGRAIFDAAGPALAEFARIPAFIL
ncbi:MAG: protein-L-isoaspartate O-methyltransferase [Hyphomicrobiales bacterium]|nr:protein-L-isoaspartate O-methyltransferase [Hyphomicrobiales bacterium]